MSLLNESVADTHVYKELLATTITTSREKKLKAGWAGEEVYTADCLSFSMARSGNFTFSKRWGVLFLNCFPDDHPWIITPVVWGRTGPCLKSVAHWNQCSMTELLRGRE